MKQEKVLIYPFDIEFCPIVRNKELLSDYDIKYLVSPSGWGYSNCDLSDIDGGNDEGYIIQNSFDKALQKCETVVFANSDHNIDFENDIFLKMKKAILNKKNLINLIDLKKEHYQILTEMSKINNIKFMDYGSPLDSSSYQHAYDYCAKSSHKNHNINPTKYTLSKIETSIIFVMGISEKTHKFQIQLSLGRKLSQLGYKVSQVGTRTSSKWLGINSIPDFMFNYTMTETQKIIEFNNYIKKIEDEEKPDVIIIGIPGGTMKINNQFTNNFGILAYEISQSVEPDYVIMSTFYEDYKYDYFDKLNLSAEYRFGFNVDCFNLANVKFDWLKSSQNSEYIYIKLDHNFIKDTIKKSYSESKPFIIDIFDEVHSEKLVNDVVDKLSNYAYIDIV